MFTYSIYHDIRLDRPMRNPQFGQVCSTSFNPSIQNAMQAHGKQPRMHKSPAVRKTAVPLAWYFTVKTVFLQFGQSVCTDSCPKSSPIFSLSANNCKLDEDYSKYAKIVSLSVFTKEIQIWILNSWHPFPVEFQIDKNSREIFLFNLFFRNLPTTSHSLSIREAVKWQLTMSQAYLPTPVIPFKSLP